jgi:hypothetical protein
MTKNELIDALAAFHRMQRWQIAVEPWDELEDDVKEIWRQEQRDLWPITAMFVADWLENYDGPGHSAHPDAVARTWLEEMA